MANDNRKPPHRHDPELARKEALQARQTHTHRSGQKESGHRQTTSRVNKRPSTHSSATSRRKNIKKNSRYQQVQRQKMMLAGGGFLILLLVIIFSARSCISSRKAAEAAAIQKAQEAAQAKKSEETAKAAQKDPVSLTISVVGDCTLGTDETFDYDTSLNAYYDSNGKDYFFQNVKEIFTADDLTVANMEGTLTTSDARQEKTFAFKGDPSYTEILTRGGVEATNLANNHSHDYGDQSYEDTIQYLEAAGITTFGYDRTAVMDVKGIKVGLIGIYELKDGIGRQQQVIDTIQEVKNQGAQVIIVSFHWGTEKSNIPDDAQKTLAHLAIDQGADLVVGHHPHVLQGIEKYQGKNIVYSLGNFCFGGNKNPSDKDTMIFQQTFTVENGKLAEDDVTNIIPCSLSSESGYNNYQPMVLEGSEKERVLQKIEDFSTAINQ